ncbi:four-carbon acid sugar kinase family protein [Shouchella sp. 1P09AA]|uniref:four-carbon acid sugar kinase family protein n=1 Tax=unclassified Shouchella TaxID=2893065 RepID=UPI0039A1AEA1
MSELLLGFYGDDFTGSTDAMEAMALHGLRTLLFIEPPKQEDLRDYEHLQCVGIAGTSRSMAPKAMKEEVSKAFRALEELEPLLVQYKICSTVDSSKVRGSLGVATKAGRALFSNQRIPFVAACPQLGRYTVFGHHFAKQGDEVYRLDRHPTMSVHPSTPMQESDLREVLREQSEEDVTLVNVLELEEKTVAEGTHVAVFDTVTLDDQKQVAKRVLEQAFEHEGSTFVVGSSGLNYGCASYWKEKCWHRSVVPNGSRLTNVTQIAAVSGSASPLTKRQIEYAETNGFCCLHVTWTNREDVLQQAHTALREGKSVLLYTARGSGDPAIAAMKHALQGEGVTDTAQALGLLLGDLLKELVDTHRLQRVAVAGGDTSGFVVRTLGIHALEVEQPLAPGAPLCLGYKKDSNEAPFEIALKGGQLGRESFFLDVLRGRCVDDA